MLKTDDEEEGRRGRAFKMWRHVGCIEIEFSLSGCLAAGPRRPAKQGWKFPAASSHSHELRSATLVGIQGVCLEILITDM